MWDTGPFGCMGDAHSKDFPGLFQSDLAAMC